MAAPDKLAPEEVQQIIAHLRREGEFILFNSHERQAVFHKFLVINAKFVYRYYNYHVHEKKAETWPSKAEFAHYLAQEVDPLIAKGLKQEIGNGLTNARQPLTPAEVQRAINYLKEVPQLDFYLLDENDQVTKIEIDCRYTGTVRWDGPANELRESYHRYKDLEYAEDYYGYDTDYPGTGANLAEYLRQLPWVVAKGLRQALQPYPHPHYGRPVGKKNDQEPNAAS
jgi:hypothetical protein